MFSCNTMIKLTSENLKIQRRMEPQIPVPTPAFQSYEITNLLSNTFGPVSGMHALLKRHSKMYRVKPCSRLTLHCLTALSI